MTPLSNTAPQFGQHILLLQEYFAACGIRFGSPADLAPFSSKIAQPGTFRSETGALLRTIMYRENLSLSHEDVFGLLCAAVAGAPMEHATELADGTSHVLLPFVNEVLRSLQGTATPREDLAAEPAAPAVSAPVEELPTVAPEMQTGFQDAVVRLDPALRPAPPALEPKPAVLERPLPTPLPDAHRSSLPSRPALITLAALLVLLAVGFLISHGTLERRAQRERAASTQAALDLWPSGTPPSPASGSASAVDTPLPPAVPEEPAEQLRESPPLRTKRQAASHASTWNRARHPQQGAPGVPAAIPANRSSALPPKPPAKDVAAAPSPLHEPEHPLPRKGSRTSAGSNHGLATVSSGILSRNLVWAPAPEYPRMARMTRTEGQVILQAVVGRDGNVLTTHVLRGHYLLRGAAEKAVRRWRYRPYLVEGEPTTVATVVTVDFWLHH